MWYYCSFSLSIFFQSVILLYLLNLFIIMHSSLCLFCFALWCIKNKFLSISMYVMYLYGNDNKQNPNGQYASNTESIHLQRISILFLNAQQLLGEVDFEISHSFAQAEVYMILEAKHFEHTLSPQLSSVCPFHPFCGKQ